jgi:hypothetical protein
MRWVLSFLVFIGFICFGVTGNVSAAEVFTTAAPYEPRELSVGTVTDSLWLGELTNYPHLYTFSLPSTTTVQVELRAIPTRQEMSSSDLAGILVADTGDGSVREVARLSRTANWTVTKDGRSGVTYLARDPFAAKLGPGVYRFEVSTPKNQAKYMLRFGGPEDNQGYFAALGEIRTIHSFYGYGIWYMLTSPYVYVPLLLLLLVIGFAGTVWYARGRGWVLRT